MWFREEGCNSFDRGREDESSHEPHPHHNFLQCEKEHLSLARRMKNFLNYNLKYSTTELHIM